MLPPFGSNMFQCTQSLVLLATTFLSLLLHHFLVSCDVLPDPSPSPPYGAYVKCPKRELSELIGEPTLGNHGFRIKISGNPERYVPGQMYTGKNLLTCFFTSLFCVLFRNAVQCGQLWVGCCCCCSSFQWPGGGSVWECESASTHWFVTRKQLNVVQSVSVINSTQLLTSREGSVRKISLSVFSQASNGGGDRAFTRPCSCCWCPCFPLSIFRGHTRGLISLLCVCLCLLFLSFGEA